MLLEIVNFAIFSDHVSVEGDGKARDDVIDTDRSIVLAQEGSCGSCPRSAINAGSIVAQTCFVSRTNVARFDSIRLCRTHPGLQISSHKP